MDLGGVVWNDTDYTNGKPSDIGQNGRIDQDEERFSDMELVFKKFFAIFIFTRYQKERFYLYIITHYIY